MNLQHRPHRQLGKVSSMAATTTAALVAATTWCIAPAYAAGPLSGLFDVSTSPPSVWSVLSDCQPACAAKVNSSVGWQSYASRQGDLWSLTVYLGHWQRSSYPVDPALCVASSPETVISQTFTFSNADLRGTLETVRGNQCGGPPRVDRSPVALTPRNQPLPHAQENP